MCCMSKYITNISQMCCMCKVQESVFTNVTTSDNIQKHHKYKIQNATCFCKSQIQNVLIFKPATPSDVL